MFSTLGFSLDDLDRGILKNIVEHPGCSIRDAIRPFLRERSESPLRIRVRKLELFELIELRPNVLRVECYPNIEKIKNMRGTSQGNEGAA
jgi:hypothetical protein